MNIDWAPVDSPTAKEYAEINKLKGETDNLYVTMGAIDGMDVRGRLKSDPNSEYTELQDIADGSGDDPLAIVTELLGEPAAPVGSDPIDALAAVAAPATDPIDDLASLAAPAPDPLSVLADLVP